MFILLTEIHNQLLFDSFNFTLNINLYIFNRIVYLFCPKTIKLTYTGNQSATSGIWTFSSSPPETQSAENKEKKAKKSAVYQLTSRQHRKWWITHSKDQKNEENSHWKLSRNTLQLISASQRWKILPQAILHKRKEEPPLQRQFSIFLSCSSLSLTVFCCTLCNSTLHFLVSNFDCRLSFQLSADKSLEHNLLDCITSCRFRHFPLLLFWNHFIYFFLGVFHSFYVTMPTRLFLFLSMQ